MQFNSDDLQKYNHFLKFMQMNKVTSASRVPDQPSNKIRVNSSSIIGTSTSKRNRKRGGVKERTRNERRRDARLRNGNDKEGQKQFSEIKKLDYHSVDEEESSDSELPDWVKPEGQNEVEKIEVQDPELTVNKAKPATPDNLKVLFDGLTAN